MAFLQVYYNDELKFKVPLNPDATRIGRTADNDVVIDNAGVSAHHAVITQKEGDFYIEDSNSTNGIFVNGQQVSLKKLQFGDEITIFKHKLKFTAVDISLAPSGATSASTAHNQAISQSHTVQVDVGQLQAIIKERQAQSAYLVQAGGAKPGQKFVLTKPRFDIGKSPDCDLRVGGWFAPKLAAKILRQSNGYFLFPEKRGKTRVNGTAVSAPVKLQNRDKVEVRGIALTFHESADTPTQV